jgi:hypothetical protein
MIGGPATVFEQPLRAGDLLITRALGEGTLARAVRIASDELVTAQDLTARGLAIEDPGLYAEVVEVDPRQPGGGARFWCRVAGESRLLDHSQMLLRFR